MSIFTSPINVLLVVVILASFIFIRRLLKGKSRGPIEIYFALVILSGIFWKIGIIGKNNRSALGSLVERTTQTTILVPLKSKQADEVGRLRRPKEVKKLPQQMRLTLTYDQGREMADHKLFTRITGVKVYFAHPRSPWERGTNENTNGLIRQFFPKGTDFNKITRKEIKKSSTLTQWQTETNS